LHQDFQVTEYIISWSDLDFRGLYAIPVGGQSELGQAMWLFIHQGAILVVDAGAAYPAHELPGVDLLLPNTTFLEANQDKILALLVTNGHEGHAGAIAYLANHVRLPNIYLPRFPAALTNQHTYDLYGQAGSNLPPLTEVDATNPMERIQQIGPFTVEWIVSSNAIADACALRISCAAGTVIYTSSFKYDQTPIDGVLLDIGRLAAIGDEGVDLLISDSSNVEEGGYTPSEKAVGVTLTRHLRNARGRVLVVMPGSNTHRLQLLFDLAAAGGRKVYLCGEALHKVAVSAAITGHLHYERKVEGTLQDLSSDQMIKDTEVLVIASSIEADPMSVLDDLAYDHHSDIKLKAGDTVIFSSEVAPGQARHMANILDEMLIKDVQVYWGARQGVHVSKHAAREELKLMLSVTKPRYFAPSLGEGRHITQHGELAVACGLDETAVFALANGNVLQLKNGEAETYGSIEWQPVLFNREQGERVTTASVNERRALSLEGVVTIGLTVTTGGEIVAGPTFECGASGFLRSQEWLAMSAELDGIIREAVDNRNNSKSKKSARAEEGKDAKEGIAVLRSQVREAVVKALRSRLSAKPTVQVLIHQI
jgi:ribonuclease J